MQVQFLPWPFFVSCFLGGIFMNDLIAYPVADAAIAELSSKYMPLKVAGLNDLAGLAAVHEARMVVKGLRVDVEKKRKELKADSLAWGKRVDGEAARITALLEPIETHLENEESIVAKEKKRIADEEAAAKKAKLDKRLEALTAVRKLANPLEVEKMTTGQFEDYLADAKAEHEMQLRDEALKEAARKAESDRLAAERAELDRQKAEQAAAQKLIDDERRRLELEKAKAEAAEKAKQEAEARHAKQLADAETARVAAEAARLRAEALRPDKEKLLAVADAVAAIVVPEVGEAMQDAASAIRIRLNDWAARCREFVNGL
jgi:hypothetical protein